MNSRIKKPMSNLVTQTIDPRSTVNPRSLATIALANTSIAAQPRKTATIHVAIALKTTKTMPLLWLATVTRPSCAASRYYVQLYDASGQPQVRVCKSWASHNRTGCTVWRQDWTGATAGLGPQHSQDRQDWTQDRQDWSHSRTGATAQSGQTGLGPQQDRASTVSAASPTSPRTVCR